MLTKLQVNGLRGFQTLKTINFAIPDGEKCGSGLTLITGPNNSGKTTIIEALRSRASREAPSYHAGMRNVKTDFVTIKYFFEREIEEIVSIQRGSSETKYDNRQEGKNIFVLPSRRTFNPFFGRPRGLDRANYVRTNQGIHAQRGLIISNFEQRLFKIQQEPDQFNAILERLLPFKPQWVIDQTEQGQHFIKFLNKGGSHSSDGVGEGIVSLFCIVDALYDSDPGQTIVVDEPELSIHPAVQKRLQLLFHEYAKDRQIILATHSPYFINFDAITGGGELIRVWDRKTGTTVKNLSEKSKKAIRKLAGDMNNPHTLGLDAREVFFLDDGIILVEGQEDVICYPILQSEVGVDLKGEFFGWGVGGADKMRFLCIILHDLGFQKVCGLLDRDKVHLIQHLQENFPNYLFKTIEADDVRDKVARKRVPKKIGLINGQKRVKHRYMEPTRILFNAINEYFE